MYKQLLILAFLLMLVSACTSEYVVKFQGEHRVYPGGDPKVSAIIFPSTSGRLVYGTFKQVCPRKPLKSVEGAVKFVITSNFVKNLISSAFPGATIPLAILPAVSATVSQIISDSLAPGALSFSQTKEAMAAAIGTAISSNYTCGSINDAARLYYEFSRDDYIANVCGRKDSVKLVIGLLKKEKTTTSLVAIPYQKLEVTPSVIDIYSRDSTIGNKLYTKEINRKKALSLLVESLRKKPICHGVVNDYLDKLDELAKLDDPSFFPLYDSVKELLDNCIIEYNGYVLDTVETNKIIFFNKGKNISFEFRENKWVPEGTSIINFSGPIPLKGEDKYFEDSTFDYVPGEEKTPLKLKTNYLFILPLVGLVIWRWKKNEKE